MGRTCGHHRSGPPDPAAGASPGSSNAPRERVPPRLDHRPGDDDRGGAAYPRPACRGCRPAAHPVAEPSGDLAHSPGADPDPARPDPDPACPSAHAATAARSDPAASPQPAGSDPDDLDPIAEPAAPIGRAAVSVNERVAVPWGRRSGQFGHAIGPGTRGRTCRWSRSARRVGLGRPQPGRLHDAGCGELTVRHVRAAGAPRRCSGHPPSGNPRRSGRRRCGLVADHPALAQSPSLTTGSSGCRHSTRGWVMARSGWSPRSR